MNWLQLKIEAGKKEKEEIDAPNLDSFKQRLDEAANTSLERFKTAKMLEDEVAKVKDFDQHIDRKLHYTKLHFEELREKLIAFV